MGKQVCFYLTKEEENAFIKDIINLGYRIAIYEKNVPGQSRNIKIFDNYDEEISGSWLVLILLDKSFNLTDLKNINNFRDEIDNLEFSRCYTNIDEKTIRHGRIYLDTINHKNNICSLEYENFKKMIKNKFEKFDKDIVGTIYASSTIIEKIKNSELTTSNL